MKINRKKSNTFRIAMGCGFGIGCTSTLLGLLVASQVDGLFNVNNVNWIVSSSIGIGVLSIPALYCYLKKDTKLKTKVLGSSTAKVYKKDR